jgi:hypothetical protein
MQVEHVNELYVTPPSQNCGVLDTGKEYRHLSNGYQHIPFFSLPVISPPIAPLFLEIVKKK